MNTGETTKAGTARFGVTKLSFLLFLVAELFLFNRSTSLYFAQIYPRWHDQNQPLSESYSGYEYARKNGFWSGVGHTITKPAGQGNLHSLWALLVFKVIGHSSRSAALAVNMLAFMAWQAAFAVAIRRGSGSRAMAWMVVGLTLALRSPWSGVQGSATDFRLDHVTMCMVGISLAAALRTDGFRSLTWSSAFGIAVGLTLLTRFLTGAYFILILGACTLWALLSRERSRRLLNLGVAAAVAALLAGPCFWFNRREIYEHYWIGHYQDPNGVLWSSHLSFGRAFLRLAEHLCRDQLGPSFWLGSGLAVLALTAGVWLTRGRPAEIDGNRTSWTKQAATLGGIFLIGPAIVLALQNNDRMVPIVLGVCVPGAVLLVICLCVELQSRLSRQLSVRATAKLSATATLITLAVGLVYFVDRQTAVPFDGAFADEARQVDAIADQVFAAVESVGIDQPRVAIDRITDCLDAAVLPIVCYERHHVWLPFVMELPTGISGAPESLLMDRLESSDFVFATESGPPGPWPYDQEMFALRPKILTWCNAHLRLVRRFALFGQQMTLYQRREIGNPPILLSFPHLVGSISGDFNYRLKVTLGRARYYATNLPAGLELDGASGWIRGRPIRTGTFIATIKASNSAGATVSKITFQVQDSPFVATLTAPPGCTLGVPVEVNFEAFDATARLDFIEITDLTTGRLLDRLSGGEDNRQNWQGHYVATFSLAGNHRINVRFVRLDPGEKHSYTFLDRSVEIHVADAR